MFRFLTKLFNKLFKRNEMSDEELNYWMEVLEREQVVDREIHDQYNP